jgi:hypothetical protein
MKKIIRLMVVALVLSGSALADTPRFFSVISDVPLMPGLAEIGDQSVVFDKPGGRFAESVADLGGQSGESVAAYYASSLPQFGWSAVGQNRYSRDGEVLVFEFEQTQSRGFVRVSLSPK